MISLPEEYIDRIRSQLGPEAEAFLASYEAPQARGLRLNPLKLTAEHPVWRRAAGEFKLEPVSWCPTGFYYDEAVRPGKHPYHAAGLYYIQEPSAMSAVECLDPAPGETILDLAAAPGGKSSQIAGKLAGSGLLVANEIHPGRAKILSENIERMGIRNAIVTSSDPGTLAAKFPGFFDRIMLDAPCSGEGMFRKDPEAIAEWTADSPSVCAARQTDILGDAVRMLKHGGILTYSTCTFNREENEDTIAWLMEQYPRFSLVHTERIWPHTQRGEGHFVAVLRNGLAETGAKEDEDRTQEAKTASRRGGRKGGVSAGSAARSATEAAEMFRSFADDGLPDFELGPGEPVLFGSQLYWLPHTAAGTVRPSRLEGLRVLRPGLHLAEMKKNRIEPSHALALAIREEDAARKLRLEADDARCLAYLRGETLAAPDSPEGWTLVTVDGFPLGWGKVSGGQLKNHYPKGLRWLG